MEAVWKMIFGRAVFCHYFITARIGLYTVNTTTEMEGDALLVGMKSKMAFSRKDILYEFVFACI